MIRDCRKDPWRYLTLGMLCLLLGGQYLVFGYGRMPDTGALESFSHAVYPLYPVVLCLFRGMLGSETGYFLLGLLQNLVLAVSICSLMDYLRRTFRLPALISGGVAVGVALAFLVQKWFTRTGIISSNTLFSEALAIPFYLLFFRYALEAFISRARRPFLLSCVWGLCLILTRGQLYWVLVIVLMNGVRLAGMKRLKTWGCAILACAGVIAIVQAARYLQTTEYGYAETRNPANLIVLSTAVYCSESEDYLLFEEGSAERQLLQTVRAVMDDPAHPVGYAHEEGSLTQRQQVFEAEYDDLKECINRTYKQLSAEGKDVSLGRMTMTLILANFVPFLCHCGQNAAVAFIRTVAILWPGLDLFALLVYLLIIVLCAATWRKPAFAQARQFAFLGMLCTVLNAVVMAPGVFALSRYVFYNMPILYLVIFIYAFTIYGCIAQRSGERPQQLHQDGATG